MRTSAIMAPSLASLSLLCLLLLSLLLSLTTVDAVDSTSMTTWKPRAGPRSTTFANRHRFFLPNPCILHDENTGAEFDITSLRRTGAGSDYTATDGDYFYRMNVCGPANAGGPCGNALICQYTTKDQHFVAKIAVYDGYFGPRLTLIDGNNPGLGVQAHYLNGDICFIGPAKKRNPRTTIVQYRCARETKDTFTIHEDKDSCTFTITLETSAACWPPGSMAGSISEGTTFLILFFLAVSLYLGIGILYNRNLGKEGKDQIPHLEFWTVTLPALVSEGCVYSWSKFQEFKEKKLKNGAGGLLGGEVDPDDPYKGKGAPSARSDDL